MNNNIDNEVLTNMKTDAALSSILSNFETSYIVHAIETGIDMRFRPYNTAMPSLNTIEQNFQICLANFQSEEDRQKILDTRESTYREIIDIICNYFNLQFNPDDNIDSFTAAYYLHQFFVSNFTSILLNFFVNYIIAEQDAIYTSLNLSDIKKNKDSNINYSKKIYDNQKLGTIHANINIVLDNICLYDISLEDLVRFGSKGDINFIRYMNLIVSDKGNVFKNFFASYIFDPNTRPELITMIKLQLQQFTKTNQDIFNPINIIKKED